MTNKIKAPLFTVPVASTAFLKEAQFIGSNVIFEYENNNSHQQGIIAFKGVAALRQRAERCCEAWHIENAYDVLVEIEDSSWAKEIKAAMQKHHKEYWELHHYMIYLDSAGCFEVIADNWEFRVSYVE